MEDKKITWEFTTGITNEFGMQICDKWSCNDYYIMDAAGRDNEFILKRNFQRHELYSSESLRNVFRYAEKLIKNPKHKEKEDLLKTIKELEDKTHELKSRVKGM